MAETHQYGSKRFSGETREAAQDYKVWKKWARARCIVDKLNVIREESFGPQLYMLLDGPAWLWFA